MIRVFLHGVLLFPLIAEKDDRPFLPISHQQGAACLLEGIFVSNEPCATFVWQGCQHRFYSILIFQPVLHHFKLQSPHSGKDEVALAFLRLRIWIVPSSASCKTPLSKDFLLTTSLG